MTKKQLNQVCSALGLASSGAMTTPAARRYCIKDSASFLNANLHTRGNTPWKTAMHVILEDANAGKVAIINQFLVLTQNGAHAQFLYLPKDETTFEKYNERGVAVGVGTLQELLDVPQQQVEGPHMNMDLLSDEPRQEIFYGAPGTGKSWGVDRIAKNPKVEVIRTTFHPDSDYSTFVGAYKPTIRKFPRIVQVGLDLKKPNYAADVDDALKVEEKISYEFRPQAFMSAYLTAWKDLAKPVVLVIEEINRGNCAQIFGDLFQLLDRDEETGYSTYPITADVDLATWLADVERFGVDGLADPGKPKCIKSDDWGKILKGQMLALPPNLYIWATMNTSDQSLFPIDSAFKRRWDWKYVPIREGKYKDGPKKGQRMGWTIKFTVPAYQDNGQQIPAKDYSYDWWEFLKNINAKIFKTTESEDKKLGYFFVKPDGEDATTNDGTISADRFVCKVIFYLWNDVFKDYGIETIFKADDAKKSDDEAKGVEFQAFFNEEDDKADVNTLLKFFKHIELKSDEEIAAAQAAQQQPTASAAKQQGQNTNP